MPWKHQFRFFKSEGPALPGPHFRVLIICFQARAHIITQILSSLSLPSLCFLVHVCLGKENYCRLLQGSSLALEASSSTHAKGDPSVTPWVSKDCWGCRRMGIRHIALQPSNFNCKGKSAAKWVIICFKFEHQYIYLAAHSPVHPCCRWPLSYMGCLVVMSLSKWADDSEFKFAELIKKGMNSFYSDAMNGVHSGLEHELSDGCH